MKIAWIDLETTGLDPKNDNILEIGVVITNADVSEEYARKHWIIGQTELDLQISLMDAKVLDMHTNSGLLADCLKSELLLSECELEVVSFINGYCAHDEKKPLLGGSSVHFDREFLRAHMPQVLRLFFYRNFDVSVLNTSAELFAPELRLKDDDRTIAHRSLADIDHSISVAKYYRDHVFLEAMPTAAEKALDDIAAICGCPNWEYPGQVVRDVKMQQQELERWRHGKTIESDFTCPHFLELEKLKDAGKKVDPG